MPLMGRLSSGNDLKSGLSPAGDKPDQRLSREMESSQATFSKKVASDFQVSASNLIISL